MHCWHLLERRLLLKWVPTPMNESAVDRYLCRLLTYACPPPSHFAFCRRLHPRLLQCRRRRILHILPVREHEWPRRLDVHVLCRHVDLRLWSLARLHQYVSSIPARSTARAHVGSTHACMSRLAGRPQARMISILASPIV